jgi:eukaryotic-like serine/threonine-protein kinase
MTGKYLHSRYSIIKFLGVGRSGQTHLAEDCDLPGNPPCIVKRIQYPGDDSFAQPLMDRVFEVQADILHKIGKHPLLPSLIGKFEEGGERYLVREFIDGEFLSEEFKAGPRWSQIQAFDFISDLMDILSFMHSYKYIHQDINPHTIIRRKQDGRFSLIGFGAIKDPSNVWQNLPLRAQEKLNSVAIGTPGYIPYEQERNSARFNSDIYAVGAIAIQGLTGEFPIPKDPITYELQWQDRVKIDLRLVKIIDRMVRPDYRNRYQSTAEVVKDLQNFAITQIPPSTFDRIKPHLIFSGLAASLLASFLTFKNSQMASSVPQVKSNHEEIATIGNGTNKQVGWQVYHDDRSKFKIKYYPTWSVDGVNNLLTGETVGFVSPQQSPQDRYRERVSIQVEQLKDPKLNLEGYTKDAIAEINKYYKNAKIVEITPIMLAKMPGNILVYTGTNDRNLQVKNLEALTIKNGKVYIITYQSDPTQYYAFLQTVMTMINSLEVK